jgi:hypothetical protein
MFERLLHLHDHPAATTVAAPAAAPAVPDAAAGAGGEADDPGLPDKRGIEVEEISQVEFLREWGRAIARKALAISEKDSGENR